ncbi:hypothetical protein PENSTE_c005G07109 [Penicillium steckii]|uniref:Uncharacterized protein n=1 Tax=Penicillium steckii TaxID=303698 RepID=A0A1V6TMD9_9EURO|nr:hypothetical protein PENSTE_c005G07109 [Penicillium steckii]
MTSSCPDPFVDESIFSKSGGALSSRWCEDLGGISCCLPCPIGYWRWKDVNWLVDDVRLALWPSIPVFVALVWLLTTYAIFPAAVTERHYLNVAPIIGLMCISIAFIIPSRGQPQQCYDKITPNDMTQDGISALTGLVLFWGSWVVIISTFFRSIALHMTVCWESKPGQLYKCVSLTIIFVGSSALVAMLLAVSGVEYTFGRISYLTPGIDRATFWGPLLGIAAASLLLQFFTVAYCATVALRPWYNYQRLRWSGYTPSRDEERVLGAQRTASRVRKIVQLQWRNSLITVIILVYVCFLAGVLMQLRPFHDYPKSNRMAWFQCLKKSNGDRIPCLSLATSLGPNEPVLIAVLSLLMLSGTLAMAFFFRRSMCTAWKNLITGRPVPVAPSNRSSYQSRSPSDNHGIELGGQSPATEFSQFTFFPSNDADSITKGQTVPHYVT